jgi:hypothetical protein
MPSFEQSHKSLLDFTWQSLVLIRHKVGLAGTVKRGAVVIAVRGKLQASRCDGGSVNHLPLRDMSVDGWLGGILP